MHAFLFVLSIIVISGCALTCVFCLGVAVWLIIDMIRDS